MSSGGAMNVLIPRVLVSIPLMVTLRAMASTEGSFFIGSCIGATAYMIADFLVWNWEKRR